MVVVAEYWAVLEAVMALAAAATPTIIAVWMALEKSVTSLSILLGFRVSSSLSSRFTALFFDTRVAIVLVLHR